MRNLADLQNFVDYSDYNVLKNAKNRQKFADILCKALNYSSYTDMLQFVEEMRGLNFHRSEDRVLFCEFVFCWLKEDAHESFNA